MKCLNLAKSSFVTKIDTYCKSCGCPIELSSTFVSAGIVLDCLECGNPYYLMVDPFAVKVFDLRDDKCFLTCDRIKPPFDCVISSGEGDKLTQKAEWFFDDYQELDDEDRSVLQLQRKKKN